MSAKFIQFCKKIKNYSIMIGISGFFICAYLPIEAQNVSNNHNPNVMHFGYHNGYMDINTEYIQHLDPAHRTVVNNLKSTQNDLTFLLDTVYVYSGSSSPKRYSHTYSENGYRLTSLSEVKEGGNWNFQNYEACTYDSVGNLLTSFWRVWLNGSFVNSTKYTFTYTTNGNVLTSLSELWENGNWVNNTRSTYLYNTAGDVVSRLQEEWINGIWQNKFKELYIYDDNSNMLYAYGDIWADSIWHNDHKNSYTYDNNGNMLTNLSQVWGIIDWQNIAFQTYTYSSANKRLSYLGQVWNDTVWINNLQSEYTYNALDYLQTGIDEVWDSGTWNYSEKRNYNYSTYGGLESLLTEDWEKYEWTNYSLSQYNYDEDGNALTGQYLMWDGSLWTQNQDGTLELSYNFSTQTEYFFGNEIAASYSSILVGINKPNGDGASNVSFGPNPTKGVSNIKLKLINDSFVNIAMYAQNGTFINQIYNGKLNKGNFNYAISTYNLSDGLYFIKVVVDKNIKVIKVLITK